MSYASVVLADSPTAYWPLSEASGPAVDAVAGVSVPVPGTNPTYQVNTPIGLGVAINGGNGGSFASVANGAPASLKWALDTSISIEFILQRDSLVASTFGIVGNRTSASVEQHWAVFVSAGVLGFDVRSSTFRWSTGWSLPDLSFHHIVLTHNGSTGLRSFYLDGVLNTSNAGINKPTSADTVSGQLTLGGLGGTSGIPGRMGNIAIYNGQELSAARVLAHYKEFLIAKPTGMFAA